MFKWFTWPWVLKPKIIKTGTRYQIRVNGRTLEKPYKYGTWFLWREPAYGSYFDTEKDAEEALAKYKQYLKEIE